MTPLSDARESEWPTGSFSGAGAPFPFVQFILKLHDRCNLACDYCYMYEGPDQGWRSGPSRMSERTIKQAAHRIAEHAQAHDLAAVDLVLHGGEPLLSGAGFIARAVAAVRSAVGPAREVRATIQTNGVFLTEPNLAVLAEAGVRVGVSLDGDQAAHDRHRGHRDGSGSHAAVARGLGLLTARYRELFSGLLCTIDLRNDPVRTYEAMLEYEPPLVDLLLPEGTWSAPPPGRTPGAAETPYADWLLAVFDRWYGAPVRKTRVRLLEEIVRGLLGRAPRVEALGIAPVRYLVVQTDGSLAIDDTLRMAYDGAPDTALRVDRDPFDQALRLPATVARQQGLAALAPACQDCPLALVCGGGHYTHRYRDGSFRHPSVYCPDLYALISGVRDRLTADVARLVRG